MQYNPYHSLYSVLILTGYALADPNINNVFKYRTVNNEQTGWVTYVKWGTTQPCTFEVLGEVYSANLFEDHLEGVDAFLVCYLFVAKSH